MAKEPELAIVAKRSRAPLSERLTEMCNSDEHGREMLVANVDEGTVYRNPDGPEAAAIIKDLVEALYQLHAETLLFLKREGKQVGVTGPGRALYDRVERALTRAGANNDQSK